MINIFEVKRLSEIKVTNKNNFLLTMYLNTDRGLDPKEKYFTIFKDMSKGAEEELGVNGKIIKKDLEKIEKFLEYEFSRKAKGLFLFSCIPENIWYVYELQIPMPNLIFTDKNPYIKPLYSLLEDYQKYCVVLLSKDKARIFTIYLAEIKEHFDVFDEVIGRHKKGGSSEARFQRHREDEVHMHFKKVAEKLFSFFKKEKFDRIIIGSTPEVLSEFETIIHPWLLKRVAGTFRAELFADTNKILKESLLIEKKVERDEENNILSKLINNLGPKKLSVAGLDDTIFELQEGRLNVLILKKGFRAPGRECVECTYVDAWQGEKCPICSGKTRQIKDIIEKSVKIAFNKDVKIEFVEGNKEFEKIGNIGGILRF